MWLRDMKINVFGLGYVGCVSAACLARNGVRVLGIDVDQTKVDMIKQGRSPIVETGLDGLLREVVRCERLRATSGGPGDADVSIVCVGTPSRENGSLELRYIDAVTKQIGDYLRVLNRYHVVSIRSTVLPGTVRNRVIPILEEHSGKKAGADFGVCMNPEFLREGTSLRDFYDPPFTVIGELDSRSGEVLAELYEGIEAPLFRTTLEVAEMLKYACNSYHALKVSFANEIGNLCKRLSIDSHEVMRIFCSDSKLNMSSYYLKPGFAFGGSCLPKDLRALLHEAKMLDVECPVLSSILLSNSKQIEAAYKFVEKSGKKKVGVIGLSFKPGTDDLRESPMVQLIEKLIGKGYDVNIYDREVSLARLFGSNRRFIESTIPHISSLLKDSPDEVVDRAEVVVMAKKSEECEEIFSRIRSTNSRDIVDLVRVVDEPEYSQYDGICW